MTVQLLGFPTTLGLPRDVVRHAPAVLRAAGVVDMLQALGQQVLDHGDMQVPAGQVGDPVELRVEKVVAAARRQRDHWLKHHRKGDLMLTIGGDHSTSLGTIWALASLGQPFDIVWIDAHGDFNVIETSPSGNPHGMVLALAAGLLPQHLPKLISPSQLKLWGIRELDPGERQLLQQERVEVLDPEQTRHERERVIGRLKPSVLLSFDIDSVDPADAPGTMTPVPGGFRRQEALDLVAAVARQRRLLAVDLVEFHPDQDQREKTTALGLDVLRAALTGQGAAQKTGFDVAAGI